MLIIDDVLVTDAVLQKGFVCRLDACKGACCVEGDAGAPLTKEEAGLLESELPTLRPFLRPEGLEALDGQGAWVLGWDREPETPLVEGKECAYVTFTPDGTALCGIEQAWKAGATAFRKPISCHLYPIRIQEGRPFEILHYHEWDICSAACNYGEQAGVPIYQFVKDALVRKYGQEWYETLCDAVAQEGA
ncbi:MAG: DUF3109 family protein [Bacteroidetes bacterium]|nr:DUF3109 family protein [Bacteroidota bacterium]